MLSKSALRLQEVTVSPTPPAEHVHHFAVHDNICQALAESRIAIANTVKLRGWALLRGLAVHTTQDFARCMTTLGLFPLYRYPDLPSVSPDPTADSASDKISSAVYGVTPFPHEEAILFHHEGSHNLRTFSAIAFHCAQPATLGGETPLVDGVELWESLPPDLRRSFTSLGLCYERRFVPGLDVSWQNFFNSCDPVKAVMDFAHQGWQAHFDAAGCLCARITLPGTLLHPQLRRTTFFNQVLLHHPACLDPEVREALAFAIGDGKMPREVHFGDGTPIPAEWIEVILNTSQALAVAFPWCVGDLLVIDNLRMAHARRPYDGMRHHHSMLGDLCN